MACDRNHVVLQCDDDWSHTHQLISMMTEAVHQFVGNAEQSDDLTMMAIQYIKENKQ